MCFLYVIEYHNFSTISALVHWFNVVHITETIYKSLLRIRL